MIDDSLSYIRRTVDMLIAGTHPSPRRALHLLEAHASMAKSAWADGERPRDYPQGDVA